jgi:hypothetical protein
MAEDAKVAGYELRGFLMPTVKAAGTKVKASGVKKREETVKAARVETVKADPVKTTPAKKVEKKVEAKLPRRK